jgi:hypothetical protein
MSGKDALLQWCQKQTSLIKPGVVVENFRYLFFLIPLLLSHSLSHHAHAPSPSPSPSPSFFPSHPEVFPVRVLFFPSCSYLSIFLRFEIEIYGFREYLHPIFKKKNGEKKEILGEILKLLRKICEEGIGVEICIGKSVSMQ